MAEEQTNNSEGSEQQAPPAGESTAQEQPKETGAEVKEEKAQDQEAFFDPKSVPQELMPAYKSMQAAFTKKTQDIASLRDKAGAFDKMVNYEPFRQWYVGHAYGQAPSNGAQAPKVEEGPSEEELQDIGVTNPKKFAEYTKKLVESVVRQSVLPIATEAKRETAILRREAEFEAFGKENPDFWELDQAGLIQPVLEKFPTMPVEWAYMIAKGPSLQEEAVKKAHNMVQQKKQAVMEKPGGSAPPSNVVKVKNQREAMQVAWDYAEKGKPPPEFQYES